MRTRGTVVLLMVAACTSSSPGTGATAPPDDDPLSPAPAVESPAPPVGQGTCRRELLRVDDADGVDEAGLVREVFVVRTTERACQLTGHPELVFLGTDGSRLATSLVRIGTPAATTLSPTATASFQVGWRRDDACAEATAVLVTLPGTTTPVRAVTAIRVCARTEVSPVGRSVEEEGTEG